MSTQQVIVKAYYNDLVEKQPEIRRFAIDASPTNDVYRALETTIAQLNADYPQGQFVLQYMDEDNDRITFSSDGEIRSALTQLPPGGTLKIYVKPKPKAKAAAAAAEQTNENEEVLHIGITCDGCQGSVVGNRYKCTQCPDYDLCQACSDKKVHSEHNMIKITRPFHGFGGGRRRCGRGPFSGRCGGGPFGGGPFGGPFGAGPRFWHHFMRHRQQQGGEAGCQMPPDMVNFLSQFKGKELAELVEAHLPEYLRTEKINQMINQFKTGEQADKPVDHNTLLKNVGEFLREVLSPFGIDCDYFVDNQAPQPPQAKPEQSETTEKAEEQPTASASASTEPKPTAPPTEEAASSSAPNVPPGLGNLFEQFQTMFAPMFQPPTGPSASAATPENTTADQQDRDQKKIEDCVERMTAMGFVDSNGVLSELIKSKKGDINQVLDALNPRNYKQ